MLYKNTFKLMFSNASMVWKLLIYFAIAFAFVAGLLFVVALPIYDVLVAEGFFESISSTYLDFITSLNLKVLLENVSGLATLFVDIITSNVTTLLLSIILFAFVCLILGGFLFNFYQLPTASVLNMYMSSNVKQGFMTNFFATIKRNFAFSSMYLITLLPIDIGIFLLLIYSFKLFALKGALLILAPFIIIIGITLLQSLKLTLFCGWAPAMVTKNKGVIGGLKSNFVVAKRRFWQTFGNAFALIITLIFINVFGGLCTFGVAIVITLPLSFLVTCIFGMVAYYMAIGQRFYVDPYNVIAPKTMEHTEKLHTQKYTI